MEDEQMSSEGIFADLKNENSDLSRYYKLKEELIDLLSKDNAINTGDYNRTNFLLNELSILLKRVNSNNDIKENTTLLTVTTTNSVTLKFEPRQSCGGNSYSCKGAVLNVKKISDDGNWFFTKDGSFQGWIHIDNVEYEGKSKKNLKTRFLNYVKRKLKK